MKRGTVYMTSFSYLPKLRYVRWIRSSS